MPSKPWSPKRSLPLKFSDRNFVCILASLLRAICPAHFILLDLVTLIIFGDEYELWSSSPGPCGLFVQCILLNFTSLHFFNGNENKHSCELLFMSLLCSLLYEHSTPASYSGVLWFKSRPGDRLYWLRRFVVFISSSRQMGYNLQLGYDRFLPRPFQFIIH
jgi:hypothetical protein